jgi:hypothetical protein
VVLGGSRYQQLEFLGGLTSGNPVPTDSALFRYGLGGNGVLDGAVRQSMTPMLWPEPREGHSAFFLNGVTHVFGGKNRKGDYLDEYWHLARVDSAFRSDYDYRWDPIMPSPRPAARWEHSAIAVTGDPNALMIVYGGITKIAGNDAVLDDVWRLWWNPAPGHGYEWQPISVTTPPALGARSGHAAVYDAPRRRMLMFGGRSTATGNPTDGTLWALTFDPGFSSATWEALGATGPSPRFDHAIGWDAGVPAAAYLFGGDLGGGNKEDDLWRLNIAATPTWQAITDLGGTYPAARSKHTVTALGHLLMVFGGRSDDSTVHVAHLESERLGELRQWTSFTMQAAALSGHTAVFSRAPSVGERIPQIYDPGAASGSRWSSLAAAPHLLDSYPQTFVWKEDSVFVAGPDVNSYKLSLTTTPTWGKYPDGGSGFRGGSAVMYRPGKVMKCGSRDTDNPTPDSSAIGSTQSIDLSLQASGSWRDSDNSMAPRLNHNLVLLPNGRVLVVGGTSKTENDAIAPAERRPEIWDPDYINGQNVGRWEGLGILAQHQAKRDYHSTALLLPDGRVLIGGGDSDTSMRYKGRDLLPALPVQLRRHARHAPRGQGRPRGAALWSFAHGLPGGERQHLGGQPAAPRRSDPRAGPEPALRAARVQRARGQPAAPDGDRAVGPRRRPARGLPAVPREWRRSALGGTLGKDGSVHRCNASRCGPRPDEGSLRPDRGQSYVDPLRGRRHDRHRHLHRPALLHLTDHGRQLLSRHAGVPAAGAGHSRDDAAVPGDRAAAVQLASLLDQVPGRSRQCFAVQRKCGCEHAV